MLICHSWQLFQKAAGEVIIKIVNATAKAATSTIDLTGVRQVRRGTLTVLQSDDLAAVITFDLPDQVAPHQTGLAPGGTKFDLNLPANSFSIVRLGVVK